MIKFNRATIKFSRATFPEDAISLEINVIDVADVTKKLPVEQYM